MQTIQCYNKKTSQCITKRKMQYQKRQKIDQITVQQQKQYMISWVKNCMQHQNHLQYNHRNQTKVGYLCHIFDFQQIMQIVLDWQKQYNPQQNHKAIKLLWSSIKFKVELTIFQTTKPNIKIFNICLKGWGNNLKLICLLFSSIMCKVIIANEHKFQINKLLILFNPISITLLILLINISKLELCKPQSKENNTNIKTNKQKLSQNRISPMITHIQINKTKKERMSILNKGNRRMKMIDFYKFINYLLFNITEHRFAIQIMIAKGVTNKNFRSTPRNPNQILNSYKINYTSAQSRKHPSQLTSISTLANNTQKVQKKINMNDEIFHRRKQNYLNTQYNKRMIALKEITKENKKIYQRINSQKSLYSQDDMNKSTTSIRSLSRGSSRISNKSATSQKKYPKIVKGTMKPKEEVKIQPQSVNNIKTNNINQFKSMFLREKPTPPVTGINFNVNTINMNGKKQNHSFSLRQQPKFNKSEGMGNMLHKIAEQMFQGPPNKLPYQNRKKLLY